MLAAWLIGLAGGAIVYVRLVLWCRSWGASWSSALRLRRWR